jgi:hypothetical protein
MGNCGRKYFKDFSYMKTFHKNFQTPATGICTFAAVLLFTFFSVRSNCQVTLKGPQGPPPKLSSITYNHPPNEGWIGRPGGILYTITNITLANTTKVYWALPEGSIRLSMDGNVYDASEILNFDAASSDLAAGKMVWIGATNIPTEGGSPRALLSKFIVTVVDAGDAPLALTDAVSLGLAANTGGLLLITGNTMIFKTRLEMLVSDDGGTTYVPHLDYYDAAPTPPEAISAYSDYAIGFYWENDPPALDNLETINVDEGDTTIITSASLKASDVESTPAGILFIMDPTNDGLTPHHGKISLTGKDLAAGDTVTMEDIENGLVSYIHDGGESTADSISFLIKDSDGAIYRNGSDSVFYLKVNVTPADDPPAIAVNAGMTLNEGETQALTEANLRTTDPESSDDKITYTFDPAGNSALPLYGLLKLNNVPLSDGATFTQADINSGNLAYQHDGSEYGNDGFVFQVTDEFGHPASVNGNSEFTFDIIVTLVNDTPVVSVNEGMTLNEAENQVISSSMLRTTDAESGDPAIIYTLDPSGNSDFPAHGLLILNGLIMGDGSTFTQDDINKGKLEYQHDGNESLLDGFVFSVADTSGGVAGEGNVAFFEINITPVNDSPVFSVIKPLEVSRGSEVIVSNSYLAVSDAESSAEKITFTLDPDHNIEAPSSGTLKLNGTALTDGQTFTMADINDGKVSYENDGGTATTDFFPFSASDPNGGILSDAGFTVFHFNFNILGPTELNDASGKRGELFTLYPNPVRDEIKLSFSDNASGRVSLKLFNVNGEKIWEGQKEAGKNYSIPFTGYADGLYYLKAESGSESLTVRFVKK